MPIVLIKGAEIEEATCPAWENSGMAARILQAPESIVATHRNEDFDLPSNHESQMFGHHV